MRRRAMLAAALAGASALIPAAAAALPRGAKTIRLGDVFGVAGTSMVCKVMRTDTVGLVCNVPGGKGGYTVELHDQEVLVFGARGALIYHTPVR